jgi:membrane fusion protein, multidrug efflux system
MRNLFLSITIILLAAACGSRANQQKPVIKDNNIPVKLANVSMDSGAQLINVSGQLSTEQEARLSFKIGGVIDRIYVTEGQLIRKGQLLATLKSAEISAQVQQVQLSLEKAKRDYQRVTNLYKDSVATLEQLQNAKTGMDIAQQNMQQIGFNQQYAKIYATADGFVVKKMKNEGELADPGSPVIMASAVSNSSKWILNTGLSDKEWAAVSIGDKAMVEFDAYPGQKFTAVVSKKALAADPAPGVFETELQVMLGKVQPAIGMFGKAAIRVKKDINGYSIPYEALLEANGKSGFVFVTNDQKTVKRVPVQIGEISQQVVYVESGLEGFSYVVISGSPYLNDGSTIMVVK